MEISKSYKSAPYSQNKLLNIYQHVCLQKPPCSCGGPVLDKLTNEAIRVSEGTEHMVYP